MQNLTLVRELNESQIVVITYGGVEHEVMIKEIYPLTDDWDTGEYGIHLMGLGEMRYDGNEFLAVVS